MTKPDPEKRRQLREEGEAARRNMQEILDRVEARMRAGREERERRRGLRRLLPFRR